MPTLATDLRTKLEKVIIRARDLSEPAAKAALEVLAVQHHEAYRHMMPEQCKLRNQLRARARQAGDLQDAKAQISINHLTRECAYEHWHRMLFARFLAENNLLIEPGMSVTISLDECKELAREEKTDLWTLAGRYAQKMLPQVFRADDPLLQVTLAREDQLKLEQLLDSLPSVVFTASDSLGWCYQFWQTKRKEEVNNSGNKIGAAELPAVTQLFTDDYMVDFLLDNTLGAWWAGKVLASNSKFAEEAKSEEELRKAVALPGVEWKYLRFIRGEDGKWRPAAGTFEGWPKTAKELRCLDPCMGSGHFVVAMFERLVALRIAEENLDEPAAVESVIRDNVYGLEIDPRCTQIAAFNLALAAWRRVGHRALPAMHLACSGSAPNTKEADWLRIAGSNERFQEGMRQLFQLFQKAPILGSLINPRSLGGDLLVAAFHELQPLLDKVLPRAENDNVREMAVTARGLAKAAEILTGQFTLVATNVPYLGRGKQDEELRNYCGHAYPEAKADLATCFVDRCIDFCAVASSAAIVTPISWLFQPNYKFFRKEKLKTSTFRAVARLGGRAFEMITGEVVKCALVEISRQTPSAKDKFININFTAEPNPSSKAQKLCFGTLMELDQLSQIDNPDAVIGQNLAGRETLLSHECQSFQGLCTSDDPQFIFEFWEIPCVSDDWRWLQSAALNSGLIGGCSSILFWEDGSGRYFQHTRALKTEGRLGGWKSGSEAWNECGVAVNGVLSASVREGGPWYFFFANVVKMTVGKHAPGEDSRAGSVATKKCSEHSFCAEQIDLDLLP